jgi:hypothetical protein
MPGLRYGRDITDDAAQLQRLITENLDRSRNADLSPEDRARARELSLNALETVRAVFGNMRTLRLFASEAGQQSDGSYTSEGRQASGLNATVPTKPALSKSAHAAYKRLEARGLVGGMKAYDANDAKSPVNYAPGSMRRAEQAGRNLSPRFARGRAAQGAQGSRRVIEEANTPSRRGQPRDLPYRDVARAQGAGPANRAQARRERDAARSRSSNRRRTQ